MDFVTFCASTGTSQLKLILAFLAASVHAICTSQIAETENNWRLFGCLFCVSVGVILRSLRGIFSVFDKFWGFWFASSGRNADNNNNDDQDCHPDNNHFSFGLLLLLQWVLKVFNVNNSLALINQVALRRKGSHLHCLIANSRFVGRVIALIGLEYIFGAWLFLHIWCFFLHIWCFALLILLCVWPSWILIWRGTRCRLWIHFSLRLFLWISSDVGVLLSLHKFLFGIKLL